MCMVGMGRLNPGNGGRAGNVKLNEGKLQRLMSKPIWIQTRWEREALRVQTHPTTPDL